MSHITDNLFSSFFNLMFISSRFEVINNSDNLFYPARILLNYFTARLSFYETRSISARIFVDDKKKWQENVLCLFFITNIAQYTRGKNIALASLGMYRSAFGLSNGRPLENIASVKQYRWDSYRISVCWRKVFIPFYAKL